MTQVKGVVMQFDEWKRVANPWRVIEAAQRDEHGLHAGFAYGRSRCLARREKTSERVRD